MTGRRSTPWRAASSSRGRRCSGCAMGCICSRSAGSRGVGGAVRPGATGAVRAGLRGSGCAALGAGGARRAVRPDARHDGGRPRPGDAGRRGVSGGRPDRRRRQGRGDTAAESARGWRHGPQRLVFAMPGRRAGPAGLQAPHSEATALGAAYLAGLQAGVWPTSTASAAWLPTPSASSRVCPPSSASSDCGCGGGPCRRLSRFTLPEWR